MYENIKKLVKEFESFIKLLEKGLIKVSIKIGIHLDKKKYGKTYDHDCGLAIEEPNLQELFYDNNINLSQYKRK